MKPGKPGGRSNPGILLCFVVPLLVLAVGLQAACPVLCGSAALCVAQKTDPPPPDAAHSCCHARPENSDGRSDRPAPRPCCCADGMLLSQARVPESPDAAADPLLAAVVAETVLFPAEAPAAGPGVAGRAEEERSKPPPLSRAELNVYRI